MSTLCESARGSNAVAPNAQARPTRRSMQNPLDVVPVIQSRRPWDRAATCMQRHVHVRLHVYDVSMHLLNELRICVREGVESSAEVHQARTAIGMTNSRIVERLSR